MVTYDSLHESQNKNWNRSQFLERGFAFDYLCLFFRAMHTINFFKQIISKWLNGISNYNQFLLPKVLWRRT